MVSDTVLKRFLGINTSSTEHDVLLGTDLEPMAVELWERFTERHWDGSLAQTEYISGTGDTRELWFRSIPTALTSIDFRTALTGTGSDWTAYDASDYEQDQTHPELYHKTEGNWPLGYLNLRTVYPAGYADDAAPADVLLAIQLIVGTLFRIRPKVSEEVLFSDLPLVARQIMNRRKRIIIY